MKILTNAQIEYIATCIHTINDVVAIGCVVFSVLSFVFGIAYACGAKCGGYTLSAFILLVLFVLAYCFLPTGAIWKAMRIENQKHFTDQNNSSNK